VIVAMWMTREVVTLRPDSRAGDVVHAMARHRLRRIPIVDAAGHVRGIVSKTDLLRATPPTLNPFAARAASLSGMDFLVADVMVHPVVTIEDDASIVAAAARLGERRLGAAPVVSHRDGRTLVGMLSQSDLARAFHQVLAPGPKQRRSLFELPQGVGPEAVDGARIGAAVSARDGRLVGLWPFTHGDRCWVLVATANLADPDPLFEGLPRGSRLLLSEASP
jgi:CBS domain-containing protein